jgi:hypothetical protein
MPPDFTERDRQIYDAHSAIECDGLASTRQIAEYISEPVATVARRLVGMTRRGLCEKAGEHYVDGTADWLLTYQGCTAAEAAVPEGIRLARWLDAEEARDAA